MTHEDTRALNVEAIEREARKLRAEHTAKMIASARTWIVAKFSGHAIAGAKTA
jgi:aryl-alcohol dehydrogenase-like predicted oxidoreductase